MKRAFVFPGQGSQNVGMGRALFDAFATARAVFEEVDETLGQKLSKVMFEGPEETLTLTENAQPAIMAVSIAVAQVIEQDGGKPLKSVASYMAGHSLGEYSALTAARSLSLADTARLLRLRGQAMQKAVPVGDGAMAAILGLDFEQVSAIAAAASEDQICAAANDNAEGQVVVSGDKAAVERAIEQAKAAGAKRSMLLPVSAPFHCALMAPAADAMAEALSTVTIADPIVPVVANVTAAANARGENVADLLVRQVTSTVQWRTSVLAMKDLGVTQLVELGSGKVLTGLARRIDRSLETMAVGEPEDLEHFLNSL